MTDRQSALVVTVKQALIDWVRKEGLRRPYHPEEDCVWLIPPTSSLSASGSLDSYIASLKDRILDAELERFGLDLRARVLREHSFDDLISISIRDHVELGPATTLE